LSIHDYRVFGLKVRSELELPELFVDKSDASPDVTITLGPIHDDDRGVGLHGGEDGLVLVVPEVASYRIEEGVRIVVDRRRGVPARNVRLFLLGSAFGALLHQRGLLPLHANAVEIDGKAIAFMGPSGAGKSTLAAWFHDHGHKVLCDDVCVVSWAVTGEPIISSGLPRLRLWGEALELMGRNIADYGRSYIGDEAWVEKFDVPIKANGRQPLNYALDALYLLERGREFSVTRLEGLAGAEAVIANTYRGSYLPLLKGQQDHWRTAIRLVRTVPPYLAIREWDLAKLDEQCGLLRDHAASFAASMTDEPA
jgi:hypothetical protein